MPNPSPTNDPYPWVTLDENNEEYRTHGAKIDETEPDSGWTFSPRSDDELIRLGFDVEPFPPLEDEGDPYPWLTIDENGEEFRTHGGHIVGIYPAPGWTFSPRSNEELEALGF